MNDKNYEQKKKLINEFSKRNNFVENDEHINYRNYNNKIYDYDYNEDILYSEIFLRQKN